MPYEIVYEKFIDHGQKKIRSILFETDAESGYKSVADVVEVHFVDEKSYDVIADWFEPVTGSDYEFAKSRHGNTDFGRARTMKSRGKKILEQMPWCPEEEP